jgi:elongation factor 1-gamma
VSLKLHTYPGNFRAFKALIAAEYNGVSVEVPAFRMGIDNKKPEFKAVSPLGKVPVLETADGSIFESNAIARYVARMRADTELLGASFFNQAQVDSWIDFCTNELEVPMGMWIFPVLGFMENVPEITAKAQNDMKKALAILNNHLAMNTYMVGRAITLADIVLVSALYYPMKLVLDTKFRKPYSNVVRWFLTCVNQPAFKAVLGEFELCKTAKVAPGGVAAAAGGKKKGGAAKQAKKEKKAAAPKPAAAPKKVKHPLELLPKSKFDLDEWKRQYSNNDIATAAMPWFFENLDQEGWSVWFHGYNYNSDNKVMFMTSNLVTGFVQRSEALRKYAFGLVHIMGVEDESPQYDVAGAWLIRGTDIVHMMEANPDAEYHTWTKCDMSSEADKAKLTAIWACNSQGGDDSNIQGNPVCDYKVFK